MIKLFEITGVKDIKMFSMDTGEEIGNIDYGELTELTEEHPIDGEAKFSFIEDREFSFSGGAIVNPDVLDTLVNSPRRNTYDIEVPIYIQRRKHKKKRINKKWAKRYGYIKVIETLKDCEIHCNEDGTINITSSKWDIVANIM